MLQILFGKLLKAWLFQFLRTFLSFFRFCIKERECGDEGELEVGVLFQKEDTTLGKSGWFER